jgi:hypothetical protein
MSELLPQGLHVRVLVSKPGSSTSRMAAFRSADVTASSFEQDLETSLSRLRRFRATGRPGQVQIKTVDYLAPYTLYAYDADELHHGGHASAEIELRLTSFRGSHYARPTFRVSKRRDPDWYAHFRSEFERVWAVAEDA